MVANVTAIKILVTLVKGNLRGKVRNLNGVMMSPHSHFFFDVEQTTL